MSLRSAPRIETERLILRDRTMADFQAFAAILADPEVTRLISGGPLSREEAWVKFIRMSGMWALKGCGFWVVEEKATGRVLGEAGVGDFKREIAPPLDGKPEFGWVFAREGQGKGYATEAVRAALDWSERAFPGATMTCIVDETNAPSLRVAAKLGFLEARRATYKNAKVIVFERPPR